MLRTPYATSVGAWRRRTSPHRFLRKSAAPGCARAGCRALGPLLGTARLLLGSQGLDARVQAAFVEPASYAVVAATREWRNMYKRVQAMQSAQLGVTRAHETPHAPVSLPLQLPQRASARCLGAVLAFRGDREPQIAAASPLSPCSLLPEKAPPLPISSPSGRHFAR